MKILLLTIWALLGFIGFVMLTRRMFTDKNTDGVIRTLWVLSGPFICIAMGWFACLFAQAIQINSMPRSNFSGR
jgi:hypothetical protein